MPREGINMPRQLIRDFGTCLDFNGTTARVVSPLWSNAALGFSISGWFKTRNPAQTNQTIFSNGDGVVGGYSFGINGNGLADGTLFNLNHTIAWNQLTYKVIDKNWHFFIFTCSPAGAVAAYVDGVSVNTGTIANFTTPVTNSYIGDDNTGRWFNGKLDEIRYWTRGLTSAEAIALYYGIEPATTNFITQYKLDEGSGSAAIDSIGAKNGTITAATYSSDVFMIPRTAI